MKKIKKTYRYGMIINVLNTIFYDFLDKESSEGRVHSYLVRGNIFTETHVVPESLYTQIYISETISYEMFENSPQLAIEILKEEHEKNL